MLTLLELTTAVDMCRMNKNDTPDIMFGRHDATVLKRLVSAFSFRPTIVKSLPHATNPSYFSNYNVTVRPTINSISMINMRLPFDPTNSPALSVQDATKNNINFLCYTMVNLNLEELNYSTVKKYAYSTLIEELLILNLKITNHSV